MNMISNMNEASSLIVASILLGVPYHIYSIIYPNSLV